MIHDKIVNINKYRDIIPDDIYLKIVQHDYELEEIELKSPQDKTFELHKKHKDLFLVGENPVLYEYSIKEGYEEIENYNEEEDFQRVNTIFYAGVIVDKDEFILFDEMTLHRPNLKVISNNSKVKIFKIEVSK